MINITGKVINENGIGISDLKVKAFIKSFDVEMHEGEITTTSSGQFSFQIETLVTFTQHRIRVFNGIVELYESDYHLLPTDWNVGDIVFHSSFLNGWTVRDRITGAPIMVTDNNALVFEIDNEISWSSLTKAIKNSASQVHMQQFYFQVNKFIPDFRGQDDGLNPPSPGIKTPGECLEKIMADAYTFNGTNVRILIRDVTFLGISITSPAFAAALMMPLFLNVSILKVNSKLDLSELKVGVTAAFLLSPPAGLIGGLILFAAPRAPNLISTGEIVEDYFTEAQASVVKKFTCDFFNPLHAKYTVIDNEVCFITASPFMNSYFSGQSHAIKDYRYGNSWVQLPIHDVNAQIKGPALASITDTFNKYWNSVGSSETFTPPIVTQQGGTNTATVQINRSIPKETFTDLPDGETGILESYLRAINEATSFIYIENQYITEKKIYDILVDKIRTSSVELIVVANVKMDLPGYDTEQKGRIRALKSALQGKESQFGFFTIWTQQTDYIPNSQKPLEKVLGVMPNYVHSKVAIIDDKWATLGSANLDGVSLRNTGAQEMNISIFNGVDNYPTSLCPSRLRNKLWNEHLLSLNQSSANIIPQPTSGGWLSLWKQKAQEKFQSIKNFGTPATTSRILEWVPQTDPKEYLVALGMDDFDGTKIKILDNVPEVYDFRTGKWVSNNSGNRIIDAYR
ncbi:MAG: phospholipase D-like domain-containing protein [Flavisolibacter sp.]